MREPAAIGLVTRQDRVEFYVRGEQAAAYAPEARVPGFVNISIGGERSLVAPVEQGGTACWFAHGNVNGVAVGATAGRADVYGLRGSISSIEMIARRGSHSVGLQHKCAWLSDAGVVLLNDTRVVRVQPGTSGGSIIDIAITFQSPGTGAVKLGLTDLPFLAIRPARALIDSGGGHYRNSSGEFDAAAMNGRGAEWVGCTGVVLGETVGFVLMDHPANPYSPAPWIVDDVGVISPSPFLRHAVDVTPRAPLSFRYRIQTHAGYVDQGWAAARFAEYVREPVRT